MKSVLPQLDINSNPMSIIIYNYLINLSPAYFGQIEFTTNEEWGLFSSLGGKGDKKTEWAI